MSPDKINEDATAHSGKAFNQKTLKIYAAKANAEPMLDVARGTYKENIEDIHSCKLDSRCSLKVLLKAIEMCSQRRAQGSVAFDGKRNLCAQLTSSRYR